MGRPTYHHGDLRRVLAETAFDLVRGGGPDAVTVREVARRAEVSPAAFYRHFADRDALLAEVARVARGDLASRMLDEVGRVGRGSGRSGSIARFLALGRGYLAFAHDQPDLLATAFLPLEQAADVVEDPNPWQLLAAALDELVAVGAMPKARRPGAEILAWSAVHGFATLRANRSFEVSGEPNPDAEALLLAIARSLDLRSTTRTR